MWRMTIPLASLTDEHYAVLGRLVTHYFAALMTDADHVTVEFRTIRLNGGDVDGLALASAACNPLQQLTSIADYEDAMPIDANINGAIN